MQVTQVEMLLRHADFFELVNMHYWLNRHNPRFLFDSNARIDYGFTPLNADWQREDVGIDGAGAIGPFIDFRFTLRTYRYPHALALILRMNGWRVNGRYRTMHVDPDTPWEDLHFSGAWTPDYEPDFPHGWSPGADRRRQEGRRI
jgi:hypothetical protein